MQSRNLDLKSAIDICKASEAASKQLRDMSESVKADVQAVESRRSKRGTARTRDTHTRARDTERNTSDRRDERARGEMRDELCGYCGRKHKREKGACPAYGKTCHACRGRNHFSTSCRQKVVNAADNASDDERDDGSDSDTVYALNGRRDKRLYARLEIDGQPIRFLLDCGATANVLPRRLAQQLKLRWKPTRTKLRMFDGYVLQTLGKAEACVEHPSSGRHETLTFHVMTAHNQPLLGIDACLLFGLVKVNRLNVCSVGVQKRANTVAVMDAITRSSELGQDSRSVPGVEHPKAAAPKVLPVSACLKAAEPKVPPVIARKPKSRREPERFREPKLRHDSDISRKPKSRAEVVSRSREPKLRREPDLREPKSCVEREPKSCSERDLKSHREPDLCEPKSCVEREPKSCSERDLKSHRESVRSSEPKSCVEHEPKSRSEPIASYAIPSRPWEHVGIDVFTSEASATVRDTNTCNTCTRNTNTRNTNTCDMSTQTCLPEEQILLRVCDVSVCREAEAAQERTEDADRSTLMISSTNQKSFPARRRTNRRSHLQSTLPKTEAHGGRNQHPSGPHTTDRLSLMT